MPAQARELMRSNATRDVYDGTGTRVVDAINPGRELRESLVA
ncbi:hypothetical protein GCM10010112_84690 [Actinoplanes lobatus]|uniref:Uncharacterized protein n=1 Tax=Actinoplanes lobatus TaxID=113568 RepID=A0A7W7MJ82_9ACTN|nr:hypothetical protein [Actinoplanes lobatus]MBB4752372.1 hypothetical protein [Actinoplanes lobatus]GGN94907.1 hypothetical protein GCM10010112_84690 [Actinoplanes lobatus]GIE45583.1 hypothetical protein Alo02nite_84810 [Actinoplanes lobatus]